MRCTSDFSLDEQTNMSFCYRQFPHSPPKKPIAMKFVEGVKPENSWTAYH